MLERVFITQIPAISAIYYALLQCGYDFYALEKDASLVSLLESYKTEQALIHQSFFSNIKQETCEVYPYWPRAAVLETACFYLNGANTGFDQYESFRDKILSAANISKQEKDASLWNWIDRFPAAVCDVLNHPAFQDYYAWENSWVARQNERYSDQLNALQADLQRCAEVYGSGLQGVRIVLSPIKCAYSSDYHIAQDRLYFSSGRFLTESVVHEFLHPIVRRKIAGNRESILRYRGAYPGLDASYLLDGSEAGRINAAEEYLVRELTQRCVQGELPNNLDIFVQQAMDALMEQ